MGRKQGISESDALQEIVDRIMGPGGYYKWTTISPDGEPPHWQLRAPHITPENETWMKDERVELIHVCHANEFHAAMLAEEKDNLAHHSGYVKNGTCTRCAAVAPEETAKKANVQRVIYEISRKTR